MPDDSPAFKTLASGSKTCVTFPSVSEREHFDDFTLTHFFLLIPRSSDCSD